ncbi:hypothetical protein KP79_PYT12815 [Mizuhopecten yessoensis]|uniref:Uncharacterized protein n=1 Tax=Mizuhopecten yessoensis TaxID=6573 RepID=A0A210PNH6_MIZYE|nr:hypothetical protein KP79_PYT12815 [Mizuhopecten yessoensis]
MGTGKQYNGRIPHDDGLKCLHYVHKPTHFSYDHQAIQETNGVTFGTEVPDTCHYNQTSQYSPPGGVYITMQNVTENCVPVVQTGGSSEETLALGSIVGGVAGAVILLVAIIVCLIGCLCCKKTKATVIIVKEVVKVQHKPKDTEFIVDVDDEEDGSAYERDLTAISSAQMSAYSSYLPRSSAKSDKTGTRFQKPPFGSPLYRDAERGDNVGYKRSSKQNGRLVKNGLYGMEDETEISFPVEQTSLPDIRKDVYKNSIYGHPDDGFAFQDLAVGATDNYKLLVKNLKRGDKNLMSTGPPGPGQVVHVRSSPGKRQKTIRNKSNSPTGRQRFRGSENKTVNHNPPYNENHNVHDRFVWSNEDDEENVHDPDFTGSDICYGGRPTGPNIWYGTTQVENNTRPPRRNASVHRTRSFGSSSNKTVQSQQNAPSTSDKGSGVNSPSPPTNSNKMSRKQSIDKEYLRDNSSATKETHLVDTSTNTDNTKERTITPKTVKAGVSIGIQTEVENTSVSNVSRKGSPIPARNLDPWRHPLLNYEFYGSTDMKKSTSVPTVISGYEMAKYNPPNIESSKHHDRMVRRLGLTSNDMVWCIEPNSRVPKRSATYNLGSNINRNNSHQLGRRQSRSRIVTPWK